MRNPLTLKIRTAIIAICTAFAVLGGGILVVTTASVSREITSRESTAVLQALGKGVAAQLARSLYVQWRETEGLVRFAEAAPAAAELRLRLETIAGLNERYAWIGLARPDGRVVTATGGILEGDSVAERPWFRAGIQAPFAGDVHEAVLLQRIIAPNATEPLRLIDFAAPVRRSDGSISGVIGSHVTWSAVRDVIRDSLRDTGRDVVLVSRSGEILVGPRELEGKALSLPSVLAARQSAPQNSVETWPDGQRYLTTVISPITYSNLPSFGWSLIIRQPADAAAAPARAFTRPLAISLVMAALIALLASLVVGGMVTRPLKLLRDSARALADNKLDRPIPDLRAYQETREIADALTRIQARLTSSSLRTDLKQAAE